MQLLLVMKTEKLKIRLNRITKTVSFESVNVGSGFFFCFVFVFVQRSQQDEKHLCFLKEVNRIMQIYSERLYCFFLWKTRGKH